MDEQIEKLSNTAKNLGRAELRNEILTWMLENMNIYHDIYSYKKALKKFLTNICQNG